MEKKTMLVWGIVAVVAFMLYFLFFGQPPMPASENGQEATTSSSEESSQSASLAPSFSLEDFEGNIVSSADFQGTPMVLNSWAVWCPFCRDELPDFAEAQKEFGDQVVIIAIDRAESLRTQKRYTDELGVTNDFIFLLDPNDSFYRSIGGFSMPETLFVNAAGEIVHHKRGPMELPEIRERIQDIL